jgi:CheY-like chemotaxis protein
MIRQPNYDVILRDVQMPVQDGFQAAAETKKALNELSQHLESLKRSRVAYRKQDSLRPNLL